MPLSTTGAFNIHRQSVGFGAVVFICTLLVSLVRHGQTEMANGFGLRAATGAFSFKILIITCCFIPRGVLRDEILYLYAYFAQRAQPKTACVYSARARKKKDPVKKFKYRSTHVCHCIHTLLFSHSSCSLISLG